MTRTITVTGDEDMPIKHFSASNDVILQTDCECGNKMKSCIDEHIEYPCDGTSVYFECEECKTEKRVRLDYFSSSVIYQFKLPEGVEEVDELDFNEIIGMTKQEADGYLLAHGFFLCINSEDGNLLFNTMELNPRRVNVDVENGVVVRLNGVG